MIINTKRKSNKKKSSPIKKRERTDNFISRQVEIFKELSKEFNDQRLSKEYYRSGYWFDFAYIKHRVLISIVTKSGINKKIEETANDIGWKIFYINYNDSNCTSLNQLKLDLKRIFNKENFVEQRSEELNNNLPRSEVWFNTKFKEEPFYNHLKIEYNKPLFGQFIPDCYSSKYRLCIEIDGSIHNEEEQKLKDQRKTNIIQKNGFNIIRVIAYDEISYKECIDHINYLIETKDYYSRNQERFSSAIKKIDITKKLPF